MKSSRGEKMQGKNLTIVKKEGENRLLCDLGSELRLLIGRRERGKKDEGYKRDGENKIKKNTVARNPCSTVLQLSSACGRIAVCRVLQRVRNRAGCVYLSVVNLLAYRGRVIYCSSSEKGSLFFGAVKIGNLDSFVQIKMAIRINM